MKNDEEKELTHIDLFSGIGGFALAAAWAGFRTVAFCDNDKDCQEVLKSRFGAVADPGCKRPEKRQESSAGLVEQDKSLVADTEIIGCETRHPNSVGIGESDERLRSPRGDTEGVAADTDGTGLEGGERPGSHDRRKEITYGTIGKCSPVLISDIRDFDGKRFRGATLLTGGFPCQPFSVAGQRRGNQDDRYLWPQMLRIIHESRPDWIVGENVSGIIRMALDQVLADLEMEGYTCRPFHIGAVSVNAPHRRMRVWIVAHRERDAKGGAHGREIGSGERGREDQNRCQRNSMGSDVADNDPQCEHASHAHDDGQPRIVGAQISGREDQAEPDTELGSRNRSGKILSTAGGRTGDADDPERSRRSGCSGGPEAESDSDREEDGLFVPTNSDASDTAEQGLPKRGGQSLAEPGEEQEPERWHGCGWSTKQWDIPWIEVATNLLRVDDGISRRMDEYLYGEGNASSIKNLSKEEVGILREAFEDEGIRNLFAKLWKISDPMFMLTLMLRIEAIFDEQSDMSQMSERVEEFILRPLWEQAKFGTMKRGYINSEEHRREHEETLPFMPYEVALDLKEAFRGPD
jgi:site-specific DNA-cytosine methylase